MFIFQKIKLPKINFVFFVISILVFGFTALIAHGAFTKNFDGKKFSYPQMMRDINEKQKIEGDKTEIIQKLKDFVDYEKYRLDKLGVNGKKQKKYFELLEKQAGYIENSKQEKEKVEEKEFKMPERPGRFEFSDTSGVVIKKLEDAKIVPQPRQKISKVLMKLVAIEAAQAMEAAVLPVIEDVKEDEKEIIISAEIRDLAKSLENNPVKIVNWVRNSITYEPYYGAKKGSIGCLKELVCNDVDASSLTISLLRASGIPARYKKTAAVFTVEQLRNLLGVAETKTAFAALAINKVPVYTLTGALDGVPLDEADFSNETYLVLEWTHVQTFYDYDERGANISNVQDLSAFADTTALRAELVQYHKKQWIPIDVIIKPYTHTQRNILADQAGFNSENFWNGFFQYQGELNPLSKYKEDILNATGQNVSDNLSEKSSLQKNFEILPITLPYAIGAGGNDQIQIDIENFTVLPDARRDQVRISLRQESNNEVLLSHSFFGAEINNAKLNLYYEGATEEDKTIIADYGGIHATPAPLVQIKPYLQTEFSRFDDVNGQPGVLTAQIGEALILKFEHIVKGGTLYEDEKFSVAGNSEGIFITLSKIQEDAYLDNLEDENRNSHLLLDGNATVAREYLKRIREDGATLKKSLDYEYNMQFGRAVVTQNRVLSKVDGVPTTFDFKGLSLDAGAYINDYSNRGNYKTHRKDFRLLWGQQASYMEAQIFKDVAGLDAISTVNGVQFAYAHPETYTVHRITSENQAEIDGLQLSDNTKANMRTDIAAGSVILTPDKQVEDGNWRGTLYVSLRPDWTGQYAIGEQVGENGGWTKDGFISEPILVAANCDVMSDVGPQTCGIRYFINKLVYVWEADINDWLWENFTILHTDSLDKTLNCKTNADEAEQVMTNEGIPAESPEYEKWTNSYGRLCLIEGKNFGTVAHKFIRTEFASKFTARDENAQIMYDYWVTQDTAKQKILDSTPGYQFNKFKFNPIAGTFSYHGSGHTAYYVPADPLVVGQLWTDNGTANIVRGDILSELEDRSYKPEYLLCAPGDTNCALKAKKRAYVLNKLGYPTTNEADAAQSYPAGTAGRYQSFIGGQVYIDDTWRDETYYVPGFIEKRFNENACQIDENGQQRCGRGTAGPFGFPVSDPIYSSEQDMLMQDFENGSRIKDFMSRPMNQRIEVLENIQTIPFLRNYNDPTYRNDLLEGIMDAFAEHDVYGVTVNFAAGVGLDMILKDFKKVIVNKLGKEAAAKITAKFVPGIGWIFAAVSVGFAIDQDWPLIQACNMDPDLTPLIEDKAPAYYCGKLVVYGFSSVLGMTASEFSSSFINRFGVGTQAARKGKAVFLSKVKDNQWATTKNAIVYSKIRTKVFARLDELGTATTETVATKPNILKYLLNSTNESVETWNGFVSNGSFTGAVKRRYHPKYASKPYKKNPSKMETYYYTQPNAFDLPQMKAAGISKDGFYRINELQDTLNIYKNNNFATETFTVNGKTYYGEIIFIKKTDGTTILSPRRAVDTDFPHPYIARGEDILCGGTIAPHVDGNPMHVVVTNKTGHYMSNEDFEEMQWIINELKDLGYTVNFIPEPIP